MMRELNVDEIKEVSGGILWLFVLLDNGKAASRMTADKYSGNWHG